MNRRALLAALALAPLAACATDPGPAIPFSSPDGIVLTTPEGMTLYVYDVDHWFRDGQSHCEGPCAELFRPFLVDDATLARARGSGESLDGLPIPAFARSVGGRGPLPEPRNRIWSYIRRSDGSLQWTYFGRPLYTYRLDLAPGDRRGDRLYGQWHVARMM
jgi:predicted lipoprotein with Yx(FWY)xxD motif